jgi:hypothetical protein
VITIGVDSIDDTLKKIEAGGGSTITPHPDPEHGCFRLLQGQQGNTMGLFEGGMAGRSANSGLRSPSQQTISWLRTYSVHL